MNKTIFILIVSFCFLALTASAQQDKPTDSIRVFSIADSAAYKGKYKFEGLPFEYMEISAQDGKLYFSGGAYNGSLNPVKGKKDIFDVSDEATFTFLRNTAKKVEQLQIEYQGETYTGIKE